MKEKIKVHSILYIRLGDSFDVYTRLKKRAPKIFIDLYVEGLYKILKELTCISGQVALVKFVVLLKLEKS